MHRDTWPDRWASRLGYVVVPAMLATALLLLVARYGVDVPYWDDWATVPLMEKAVSGTLAPGDLWRPHSVHRIFFPRLLMAASARYAGGNLKLLMYASVLLAAALYALLAIMIRGTREPAERSGELSPVATVVAVLVFGLGQWQNWVWAFQVQILLCVAAVVCGVFFLSREGPWNLVAAVVCSAVASLSFFAGLLSWGAMLPSVLARRDGRWIAVGWLLAGWGVVSVYLHDLVSVARGPAAAGELPARELVLYCLAFLGSPVASSFGKWSIVAGFVGVVAFGLLLLPALVRRGAVTLTELAPWCSLAVFAMAAAVVTALGRAQYGVGQALSSRYVSMSTLFWIALVVTFSVVVRRGSWSRPLARALVSWTFWIGLCCVLVPGQIAGFAKMRHQCVQRTRAVEIIRAGRTGPELEALHPRPEEIGPSIQRLRRLRLSLFR